MILLAAPEIKIQSIAGAHSVPSYTCSVLSFLALQFQSNRNSDLFGTSASCSSSSYSSFESWNLLDMFCFWHFVIFIFSNCKHNTDSSPCGGSSRGGESGGEKIKSIITT